MNAVQTGEMCVYIRILACTAHKLNTKTHGNYFPCAFYGNFVY